MNPCKKKRKEKEKKKRKRKKRKKKEKKRKRKNGHAWARMGEHVTKLISIHSFNTKNISSKFHGNLMNQIQDILKKVYFGTKYGLIWA